MQLNQKIRDSVGVDLKTVPRMRGYEIFSTRILEEVGKASGFDLSSDIAKLSDICAFMLVESIDFDFIVKSDTAIRLTVRYDWLAARISLERDGEHIAMAYLPATMSWPSIEAAALQVNIAIKKICELVTFTEMHSAYTYDQAALEDRGIDWIRDRLDLGPMDQAALDRYNAFKPHHSVTYKSGQLDGASVSLSAAKGVL